MQTSYKIALLRSINDVVLAYPDVAGVPGGVAVPLRMLAEGWVAYYWPFVDPRRAVWQGVRRTTEARADIAFRPELGNLRVMWEEIYGPSGAAGGWQLVEQMRIARVRDGYPGRLRRLYRGVLSKVMSAIKQPIRYAGSGGTPVFAAPQPLLAMSGVTPLPGAVASDLCLRVPASLWASFRDVSLWVEALCIHEWSQFTERMAGDTGITRGEAYALLTERPDNRLPLQWERNQVNVLMLEGNAFYCPWTSKRLATPGYDLDHIVPVSVYPFHELWNLVPSDPAFNRHQKRGRLPSVGAMRRATPGLVAAYGCYLQSPLLTEAFGADIAVRFSRLLLEPEAVAQAVWGLVESIGSARNVARF